ncbi:MULTISPECIES: SMI1/KNR4 family protein [unclassified Streptomyces]|uniref:SMI1/KNR4 family protein n=1 Tax=unclassified Streptomyces TaxID=2593676 RepID=UPI002E2C87D1|nr:SMI1/KNR4 family protein [Streptomyces sp. NBC_00223]
MMSEVERVLPGLHAHRRTRARGIDWRCLEEALGVVFPDDYKELAGFYPAFEVCDFFRVGGPRPGGERAFLDSILSDLEDLQESYDAEMTTYRPHPAPEDGGLLPWGESSSGDRYYWRIEDQRPVAIVTGSRSDDFWEFPGSLSEFLAAWLGGTVQPTGQPTMEQLGGARYLVFGP